MVVGEGRGRGWAGGGGCAGVFFFLGGGGGGRHGGGAGSKTGGVVGFLFVWDGGVPYAATQTPECASTGLSCRSFATYSLEPEAVELSEYTRMLRGVRASLQLIERAGHRTPAQTATNTHRGGTVYS